MRNFKTLLVLVVLLFASILGYSKGKAIHANTNEFKVMTWNIWGQLNLDTRYTIDGKTGRDRVIEIIKDSKADIITMTETYGSAVDIAEALNYNYYTPSADANLAIFSRFPMESFGIVKNLSPLSFITATVMLPNNKKVKVYNIWLTSGGRHIVEIKNNSISDEEFNNGDENRYNHIQELLQHPDFKNDVANKNEIPVIVAGDFNSISHLDYTRETKEKSLNYSRILANKTSLAMKDNGFIDSYRFIHPIVTAKTLGFTWTTVGQGYAYESGQGFVPVAVNPNPEYRDPYARIDFIYCAGDDIKPINSRTIIHHPSNSSRSFPEFPSDHGAVITTFQVNTK